TVPTDHGRPNARRDVVIARGNIRGQRAEGVERRLVAAFQLLIHIFFDQVHGHVARAFDHALNIVLPGNLGSLSQALQLAKLCRVVGIGNGTRAQAVTEAEGDIVGLHDFADVFKVLVQEAFLVVRQTPLGHDRAAPGHDAGGALGSQWYVVQTYAGMDGEVIHALLRLFNQGVAEDFPSQVFGHT